MADVVGDQFTRGALYMVEHGRARPSSRMLALIALRTRRPVTYFLPEANEGDSRQAVDELARLVSREEFAVAVEAGKELIARPLPMPAEAEARLLLGRAHVRLFDGRSARLQLELARDLYELLADPVMNAEVLDELACAYHLDDDPRALPMAWRSAAADWA